MNDDGKPDKPKQMDIRPRRGKEPGLGRDVQAKIGQQLRAYYDGLIEPTPNKFVDLLRQLDESEDKGSRE